MGIFSDSVMLILRCRDKWREGKGECEPPAEGMPTDALQFEEELGAAGSAAALELSCNDSESMNGAKNEQEDLFNSFFSWLFLGYEDRNITTHSEIIELLDLVTFPHPHSLYGSSVLREKLSTPNVKKAYRVAYAIDSRNGEQDRRLRQLFEHVVQENYEFSYYALVCAFFTYRGDARRSKGKQIGLFQTIPSTRFEQIIFVTAIAELSSISNQANVSRHKRNGISKRRVSVSTTLRIGRRLREISQKIGFTIQAIVRSWDILAKRLGFRDTEDMILPYAILSDEDLRFVCIRHREDGYTPCDQSTSFKPHMSSTRESSDTFPGVFNRPGFVDNCIRELTEMFLTDIRKTYLSSTLYELSCLEKWDHWQSFVRLSPDGLPQRFKDISLETLKAVHDSCYREVHGKTPGNTPALDNTFTESNHYNDCTDARSRHSSGEGDETDLVITSQPPEPCTQQDIRNSREVLRRAMEPYARLWRCEYKDLEETDEILSRQPVFMGDAQLSLYYPRVFLFGCGESEKLATPLTIDAELEDVVSLLASELRCGGHGIVICDIEQYVLWKQKFTDHLLTSDEFEQSQESRSSRIFEVDPWPMCFISNNGPFISSRASSREEFCGDPVVFAIHVTKTGSEEVVGKASIRHEPDHVHSSFPYFVNIFDNVQGLVNISSAEDAAEKIRARVVDKPLNMMKQLIQLYTAPGDLVVDRFGGTFVTGEACLDLRNPRVFVGCEPNETIHSEGLDRCLHTFAKRVLQHQNCFKALKETKYAARVYLQSVTKYSISSRVRSGTQRTAIPCGKLPPYQCFPPHILTYLGCEWMDTTVMKRCLNMPFNRWPKKFQDRFHAVYQDGLLRAEAVACGVIVAPSKIKHSEAGLGLFAARTFHRNDVICSYYGTLVYTGMSFDEDDETVTYGEGVLSVDVTRFKRCAMQLQVSGGNFKAVRELFDGKLAVFIVPPSFCVASKINDAKYEEGDAEMVEAESEPLSKRHSNVVFMPSVHVVRKFEELLS